MSCVEKRHMNHRMGSMLHHRFPNGFTDLFMDENDREVSTLTDRAFRSLCVGDDAAYNDDFLYGYSPFNCHKPLAGEPKTTRRKESKKRGNSKADKNFVQHQESLSHMSSFLKALSATGESCEGMLIKNGDVADSKGESWDKSALRSIQRELSEFSSDYRSLKDAGFPTEKCSKKKNGKSTVKLKKLNIRNFFFHSEFSPFQTWRDLNQFHFGPECTVLPTDNIPTWYDMRFYKELTETHRKDTLHGKEEQSCQNVTVDPSPIAPKPTPPSPPSEIPKKPTATQAEKSSSSDGGDENAAPWRRNRPRTKSVIPNSQAGVPPQENSSKPMDDGLPFLKKQVQSVEVKAVEEATHRNIRNPPKYSFTFYPGPTEDEKPNVGTQLQKDLKEKIGDMRDHNPMIQVLAQTEPLIRETHIPGCPGRDNNPDTVLIGRDKLLDDDPVDPSCGSEEKESGRNLFQEPEDNKGETPPVPPRSKKAGNRRDSSVLMEVDSMTSVAANEIYDGQVHLAEFMEGISQNKNKSRALQADTIETTFKNANENMQRTRSQKKNAPFLPNASDDTITKNLVPEEPDKMNGENVRTTEGAEASKDTLRDVISPLLSINGTGITQNPPDQSSQSSKSSYFSVESALHRNAEADVYHSLENLTGEAEFSEEPGNMPKNMKTALDYYCLSDPEIESEDTKGEINVTSQKEKELCQEESTDGETRPPDQGGIPVSPPTTFSPPLEIPALFKVKDNTAMNKKNTTHPWSPRGSLSGSERGEEETHRFKENPDLPLINEPIVADSTVTVDDTFSAQQSSSNIPTALLHTPSMPQGEKLEGFLTVPQEEDRFSGVSPSSALESLTTSAADTGDETGLNSGVSKVPSERSGSTCSGNDSQIGLPKPPAVLPKSEKAVLRAIKLTNRRMKKDVQRSTHKPAQSSGSSSSRQRAEGHQSDKTEHKSSNTKNSKNGGKHTEREKPEAGQHHNRSCDKNIKDEGKNSRDDRRGRSETRHRATNDTGPKTRRQSTDSVEGSSQSGDPLLRGATERQGRSSNRHVPDKPQQRHYSTDRVISNVPVYKAHSSQRSTPDRTFQRSQSIDRYMADRAERRLSTDMLANEKLDPRTQCNEKSIMEGFQQRGRSRDKVSREHPLRRSHSIDVYGSDVAHPSTLSRQSSHTSKFSRQPSIEHAIVTQSFPVTQRKLLQDPDSGQYFFVDMPIQVKTKTFFDPETGSYLQLPVQPPEGAVTQASALEVLTPPVVVYHSFVPVPLSPLAQNGTIQATHTAPQDFEQRHTEKSQQMHREGMGGEGRGEERRGEDRRKEGRGGERGGEERRGGERTGEKRGGEGRGGEERIGSIFQHRCIHDQK
ncbi:hypothetical protein D4764_01G0014030 [Takifugu flavidus]|uniref:DUF4585 domain-containing protein n=1 Tax=Takifugu flavidus TaxID=433684 RepID=A0A5C6PRZ2_9TELE|nr:hypothetical protein D4764_01G0014030 [Takifugu flavidus]